MNSSCPDRDISIKKAVLLLFLASKSASSSRPDMSRSVMNISVTPRFDGKISSKIRVAQCTVLGCMVIWFVKFPDKGYKIWYFVSNIVLTLCEKKMF